MADSTPANHSSAARHRVGVCSWSLRPQSPGELIDAMHLLRITAVQLALSPLVHQPEVWRDAIEQLQAAGIVVLSGMMATRGEDYASLQSIARTGGVRPDEHWSANLEHARAVADLAATHAIPLVTFHAGFIPHDAGDPERATMIERLRAIGDIFAMRAIDLAFETGQETAATLIDALRELDRPNVGVNFDPANMILYGMGDPINSLRLLAPHVRQIHVKDALPTKQPGTWGSEVVVGTGEVDWPRFFEIANVIAPPVDFIIEREAGPVGGRPNDIAIARDVVINHLRPN